MEAVHRRRTARQQHASPRRTEFDRPTEVDSAIGRIDSEMGFYRIGREREAIPHRGEDYRSAVAKYLQSKGLRIDAEAPLEGSFEDIVCLESATARILVETKGTRIWVHSRKFLE